MNLGNANHEHNIQATVGGMSVEAPTLLQHLTNTLPYPLQVFFPQGDFAITAADREDIPSQTPRHTPHGVRELGVGRRSCWAWV